MAMVTGAMVAGGEVQQHRKGDGTRARPGADGLRRCRWGRMAMQWGSLAGALSWPMLAAGQNAGDRRAGPETVENRVRPGLEGTGFEAGSLRILPSVAFGAIATDDLYARRVPRVSDVGASLAPALAVQSRWDRHALTLRADGLFERYARHGAEGTDRYGAGIGGRIDIGRDTRINLDAAIDRRIEARGTTGDTLFGVKPIAYRQVGLGGSVEQQVGATHLAFDLRFDRFHYFNRHDGDSTIVLSQRDYQALAGGAKVIRPISSAVAVSVAVRLNATRYPHENPAEATRRAHGYAVMAGVAFGQDRLLEGELALGYLHQRFTSPAYPTIAGLAYDANLRWHVTPLTTFSLAADKTIQRSPIVDVAGIEQQQFSLGAAHELLRTLILRPTASYTVNRFRGGARVDRYASVGLSATWQAAPHLMVEGTLRHALGRSSALVAKPREYDQNRATITLKYVF
ncbi:outer membrane beta-barrel protein [Novosphingobium sp. SG720]|uniref:outer membrane beta-barrel protein n=1 Tax=Novosphingobium sp. SG720 TaxID=2586998 RepID=UPI001447F399|nr:outer membrane beta-barrel protein [Novosphingobium sp. SG720]